MAESLIPKKDLSVTSEKVISALGYTPMPDNTVIPADTSGMISDAYISGKTYAVGDYCIHENQLWKCKVVCSGVTPSEGTYWTKRNIMGVVKSQPDIEIGTVISSTSGFTDATFSHTFESKPKVLLSSNGAQTPTLITSKLYENGTTVSGFKFAVVGVNGYLGQVEVTYFAIGRFKD